MQGPALWFSYVRDEIVHFEGCFSRILSDQVAGNHPDCHVFASDSIGVIADANEGVQRLETIVL